MSEENQDQQQEQSRTFTAEEVQALLEKETRGLKAKVDELLGESKSAKQKARELEEAQAAIEEARAKEKGEFKELWEREQKAKAEIAEKYDSLIKRIQQKEVEGAALSIASELTRDTKRAELLRKEISQFARYTDDGVKFEMGGVEVDRAKVMAHITDNYPFLVDGSGATGGGATGANKGGGAAILNRSKMTAEEKAAYVKEHGQAAFLKLPK